MEEYTIPDEIIGQLYSKELALESEEINKTILSLVRAGQPVKEEKPSDPISYLKKMMQEKGLRNKDLKIYIGSSGNVSAILNRKKTLSLRMIRNLNRYLNIPAEILIQPYECR